MRPIILLAVRLTGLGGGKRGLPATYLRIKQKKKKETPGENGGGSDIK